ncbi:MAG: hypothetical protein RI897_1763 [Verrucomicrobiota bacterium]
MFDPCIYIIDAEVVAVAFSFFEVERSIDGDAVDPGKEAGLALEGGEGLEGFDERLLGEVVCVFVVSGDLVDRAIDALLISAYERIVGLEVP